jgi:hypothetical protein
MSVKDLKSVLFKNIIDDFYKNEDAYMFYLYPLVFKIKTNQFHEKCYSLFSKIKKEKVKKFDFYKINKYLKKDYCNDIKIILKAIFQSSYLTKNNEYALFYIKKLMKKPSTINNINLIYRLLSNVKNNKKTGGMFHPVQAENTFYNRDALKNSYEKLFTHDLKEKWNLKERFKNFRRHMRFITNKKKDLEEFNRTMEYKNPVEENNDSGTVKINLLYASRNIDDDSDYSLIKNVKFNLNEIDIFKDKKILLINIIYYILSTFIYTNVYDRDNPLNLRIFNRDIFRVSSDPFLISFLKMEFNEMESLLSNYYKEENSTSTYLYNTIFNFDKSPSYGSELDNKLDEIKHLFFMLIIAIKYFFYKYSIENLFYKILPRDFYMNLFTTENIEILKNAITETIDPEKLKSKLSKRKPLPESSDPKEKLQEQLLKPLPKLIDQFKLSIDLKNYSFKEESSDKTIFNTEEFIMITNIYINLLISQTIYISKINAGNLRTNEFTNYIKFITKYRNEVINSEKKDPIIHSENTEPTIVVDHDKTKEKQPSRSRSTKKTYVKEDVEKIKKSFDDLIQRHISYVVLTNKDHKSGNGDVYPIQIYYGIPINNSNLTITGIPINNSNLTITDITYNFRIKKDVKNFQNLKPSQNSNAIIELSENSKKDIIKLLEDTKNRWNSNNNSINTDDIEDEYNFYESKLNQLNQIVSVVRVASTKKGGKGIIRNHKLHYLITKIYKDIKILTLN